MGCFLRARCMRGSDAFGHCNPGWPQAPRAPGPSTGGSPTASAFPLPSPLASVSSPRTIASSPAASSEPDLPPRSPRLPPRRTGRSCGLPGPGLRPLCSTRSPSLQLHSSRCYASSWPVSSPGFAPVASCRRFSRTAPGDRPSHSISFRSPLKADLRHCGPSPRPRKSALPRPTQPHLRIRVPATAQVTRTPPAPATSGPFWYPKA